MSFSMTTKQVYRKQKTVTRRFGWWFLKPGDVLWAVEKCMGLKLGETVTRICLIRVISTRQEPLNAITRSDCIKEGFPHFTPEHFVKMMMDKTGCDPTKKCNRIEFEYI